MVLASISETANLHSRKAPCLCGFNKQILLGRTAQELFHRKDIVKQSL